MASLLKLPDARTKGVLTVTTQERDNLLRPSPELTARLLGLKDRWVVGLHHNWHDHQFRYDPLYDFSMAGPDDLREVDGRPVPLVQLDACNFTPADFRPGQVERFWDVLYVARPVAFKGFPTFLETVRRLYDDGHDLRVLCLCPMPPYVEADRDTVMYDVRERYEALFPDRAEQDRFTLLTMDWRYPFPLDLPTLAHLYRSSRVFAHFAPDERRCRVAAYAWSTGLPVVGTAAVGSLLPPELRRPPAFFEAQPDKAKTFARAIVRALGEGQGYDAEPVRGEVSETRTTDRLRQEIDAVTPQAGCAGAQMALGKLDLRLGRHHGISLGTNRVPMTLEQLLARITHVDEPLQAAMRAPDPELALAEPPISGRRTLLASKSLRLLRPGSRDR